MDLPNDFVYMLYQAFSFRRYKPGKGIENVFVRGTSGVYFYTLHIKKPSIRYHDTSYIINKKWQKGGEELTFPMVYSCANSDLKVYDYVDSALEKSINDYEDDKIKFKNLQTGKIRRNDECFNQTSNDVKIYTAIEEETNIHDSTNESKKEKQSKLIGHKTSDIAGITYNNNKIYKNLSSSNTKTKLDEIYLNNKSSDHKSSNKTTIIVSYQVKELAEYISENEHETKQGQTSLTSRLPKIKINEIPDMTDVLLEQKVLVDSSFTNTKECKAQNHIKSIVIADVYTTPIALADALVIKENSSDEENERSLNLSKEIQGVPKFSKNYSSKSLNTIEEIDIFNSKEKDLKETKGKKHASLSKGYESENSFIIKNSKLNPYKGRECYNLRLRLDCTTPSSEGTSISPCNDSDLDYSMSDYEIVELRRRNSAVEPLNPPVIAMNEVGFGYDSGLTIFDKVNLSGTSDSRICIFPLQSKRHRCRSNSSIADNLHLHYVTQRILASILPPRDDNIEEEIHSNGYNIEGQLQDEYEKEIIIMLEQKHGKNYRVFDLESCISLITLERICELCKRIDKWLGTDPERIVVLQDRNNRQRLGVTVAAYLEYLDICSSNLTIPCNNSRNLQSSTSRNEDLYAQNTISKNWLDLDIFSMKKFLEDFIGPLRIPSHRRYIQYFSGLLSGKVKMNSTPFNLQCISIESPPSWPHCNETTLENEWSSFIKIYKGLHCIYTSDIHTIPISTRQILFHINNLQLHGDILIRFYRILPALFNSNSNNVNNNHFTYISEFEINKWRELLFSLQFHTCATDPKKSMFEKNDMDYAWCDNRFPKDCKITFYYGPDDGGNSHLFQSQLIRIEPANKIANADSIENLDFVFRLRHADFFTASAGLSEELALKKSACRRRNTGSKYNGTLNGSLYASISKKNNISPYTSSSQITSNCTSTNSVNLIQPTLQVINRQSHDLLEFQQNNASISKREKTIEPPVRTSSLYVRSTQSLPRSISNCSYIDNLSNAYKSDYKTSQCHQARLIFNVNQFNQQQQSHTLSQQIFDQQNNNVTCKHANRIALSADSGISNDLLNSSERQQSSSFSPKSVAGELISHEDPNNELDEIISDMLMNVRDIPDYVKSRNQNQSNEPQSILRKQQTLCQNRSQSAIPIDHSRTRSSLNIISPNANQNTKNKYQQQQIKRSLSYNTCVNDPEIFFQSLNQSAPLTRENLELYVDTYSTTTTLTPTTSENGGFECDTPTTTASNITLPSISIVDNIPATNTLQQNQQHIHRESCETYSSMASSLSTKQSAFIRQQDQTREVEQQLNIYKKINKPISGDEENIPYHAREDSQPFSYGNVPNYHKLTINSQDTSPDLNVEIIDSKMIKAQSGLSSPSLVRKYTGGNSIKAISNDNYGISSHDTSSKTKKTPINDFEGKMKERRQKVLSEKYSTICNSNQKYHSLSNSKDINNLWLPRQVSETNCYHYYNEPLKRFNTLNDFHRSNSTEG